MPSYVDRKPRRGTVDRLSTPLKSFHHVGLESSFFLTSGRQVIEHAESFDHSSLRCHAAAAEPSSEPARSVPRSAAQGTVPCLGHEAPHRDPALQRRAAGREIPMGFARSSSYLQVGAVKVCQARLGCPRALRARRGRLALELLCQDLRGRAAHAHPEEFRCGAGSCGSGARPAPPLDACTATTRSAGGVRMSDS